MIQLPSINAAPRYIQFPGNPWQPQAFVQGPSEARLYSFSPVGDGIASASWTISTGPAAAGAQSGNLANVMVSGVGTSIYLLRGAVIGTSAQAYAPAATVSGLGETGAPFGSWEGFFTMGAGEKQQFGQAVTGDVIVTAAWDIAPMAVLANILSTAGATQVTVSGLTAGLLYSLSVVLALASGQIVENRITIQAV